MRKKRLVRERVYASIKGAIISGAFEPGRRLIEVELAEDMKTSRTPVREALQNAREGGAHLPGPEGRFCGQRGDRRRSG